MKEKETSFNIKLDWIEFLGNEIIIPEKINGPTIDFTHQINIGHKMDFDHSTLIAAISVETFAKEEPGLKGTIKINFIFSVDELRSKVEKDIGSDAPQLPEKLVNAINSIALSTTRGIMFSTYKGTILHKAILPLVQQFERH